jgi:hypothetical protein
MANARIDHAEQQVDEDVHRDDDAGDQQDAS